MATMEDITGYDPNWNPEDAMGPLTRAGAEQQQVPSGPLGSSPGPWSRGLSTIGRAIGAAGRMIGPAIPTLVRAGQNALLSNATNDPLAPARRDAAYSAIEEANQRTAILQEESNRRNRLERLQLHREALKQSLFQKMKENPNIGPADYRRMGLMLAAAGDTKAGIEMMRLGEVKAPTTRTIQQGLESVAQEWDDRVGEWREVGRGPKKAGVEVGNVTVNAAGNQGLTNSVQSKAQERVLNLNDTLSALDEMKATYEPEFLQIRTKFKGWESAWKEKLGVDLSPEEQREFSKLTTFRSGAFEHMSNILHQLSGAAISPAEYARLIQSLPDPGVGWGDGDSPTQFEAKLKRAYRSTKLALVRWKFASENGIPFDSISLSEPVLKHRIGMAAEKRALARRATQEEADAAGNAAVDEAFGSVGW